MACIKRTDLSMSGCSHSTCHKMADTGCLRLMIPRPKARPKHGIFQSPGLCFQNPASVGWGCLFRVVISWLLMSLFQVNHQNGSMILSVNHSNWWNRNKRRWQWTMIFPIIFVYWCLEHVKRLAYTVPELLISFLDFGDASTKIIIWVLFAV